MSLRVEPGLSELDQWNASIARPRRGAGAHAASEVIRFGFCASLALGTAGADPAVAQFAVHEPACPSVLVRCELDRRTSNCY
jgi:hypothetical protein